MGKLQKGDSVFSLSSGLIYDVVSAPVFGYILLHCQNGESLYIPKDLIEIKVPRNLISTTACFVRIPNIAEKNSFSPEKE